MEMTEASPQHMPTTDLILIGSLAYLSVDLVLEWDAFRGCAKPVHVWLIWSYVLVLLGRLIYLGGSMLSTQAEDFLLNLRQKSPVMKVMFSLIWLVIVPCSMAWTVLGTVWIYEVLNYSPQCFPDGMHIWFFGAWQLVSYAWLVIYCGLGGLAMFLERRVRKAEADFGALEDSELLSRWGSMGRMEGYTSLPASIAGGGLAPTVIQSLPGLHTCGCDEEHEECSICLQPTKAGDTVRRLPACGHSFHRSCVDLWLLRSSECPLCKQKVEGS